ncbi:MAG: D-2-hydroxyacid dehydrogenase [Bryobacteraceae bacterium]
MDRNSILVLANPAEATLSYLERLPPDTSMAVGEDPEAFRNMAGAADIILSWSTKKGLLEAVFAIAPNVKWVHSRAAGLDGLLFPALVGSPAALTNGRGVFSQSLGEFAMAAVLFFAKDLRRMVRSQMAGKWDQFDIDEIRFQTMGIVGYGDIGRACSQRAKAFGMTVLGVRKSPEQSAGDPCVDRVYPMEKLYEVLAKSDYVVVSTPLTSETRGLIGDAALRAMKPSSVLINLGRGPVIEEAALIRALKSRQIRGAAVDVFDVEPLPAGHPYYSLDNLLLSPHCADHTRDWLDQAMLFFIRNFERYRAGESLLNVVDKTRGY